MHRWFALSVMLVTGIVLGVGLVVACGDGADSADAADAACNCPPAEPPLTGRIRRVQSSAAVTTIGISTYAPCSVNPGDPTLGIVLGGGCALLHNREGMALRQASMKGGPEFPGTPTYDQGYYCEVVNTTGQPTDEVLVATAICLYPE